QSAKRAGALIVGVNPLREAGLIAFRHPQHPFERATPLSDLFLQVRVNGDVALFQGLGKALLEAGAVDDAFVRSRTEGFEIWAESVRHLNWADIEASSGVNEAEIRAA